MKLLPLIVAGIVVSSCSSYEISDLLKPHTDKRITYECEFYNPEIREDTLREEVILETRSFEVGGKSVYYYYNLLEDSDVEILQSSNYFLDAVLYVDKDTVFAQSIFWDDQRSGIDLDLFTIKLSGSIIKNDTLHFTDGNFDYALTGARKESVEVPYGEIKKCIRLELITFYSHGYGDGDNSSEFIWLHPRYGVVKWIRSTGRTELMSDVNKR